MTAHIHRIIIFPPRFVIAVKMGLCFLLQNGKQCLDRCRERDIYNYNISYYREKIYGIYRTYRSFVDKAITMRKLLYWCPMCMLAGWGGGESAAVSASRPADAYLCLPGRFTRHRRSTKNWKTYTAEQSDRTVGLLFFRTHSEFYKISKHTEKLQKMLCSDVPVFRYIFCGIKILFSIYP